MAEGCTTESDKKKKTVFIYLHTDDLEKVMKKLTKKIKVKHENIASNDGSLEHKNRTIIAVRHGSTRIDSDIQGCCRDITESDIKRTVVVIVCGFEYNKKDSHGIEISPKSFKAEHEDDIKMENLKSIVQINYKCLKKKKRKRCENCNTALDILKMHAESSNDN
ncbi:uncharacterized protein LOC132742845 [Ruditapes philippinarum]|uniref:uncharacterized protein LOC132742845 n=1 Tax=Ruditapes philippinarum TaxID=129788 RepID=UPI00295B7D12|nr:uncharacterized protein LOC132742845 [Ruditapes philippinarum]